MASGKNLLGLDIGSSSIKIVELKEKKGVVILQQLGIIPLSPEIIVEGAIIDSYELINNIKLLASSYRVKNRKVAVSVSGTPVIVKRLSLPFMPEKELSESIDWEVEKYLPFDLSEVNIDYHVLKSDEEANQTDVLIAAVKKEIIQEYLSVVWEAGFKLSVVDVDAFAIENAYRFNVDEINETTILVNLGASLMNINILSDGETTFTRDIALGGNDFTKEIQKQMGNTFDEAERLKTEMGLNSTQVIIMNDILDTAKSSIANEILKSINFFNSTYEGKEVKKIILSGGTSLMAGMAQSIQATLNIPTEIMNPFQKAEVNKKSADRELIDTLAPVFSVAFGLALRKEKEGK